MNPHLNRIPRSGFLSILKGNVDKAALVKITSTSGIQPYTGAWGETQILHLLRRTLFGVSQADYTFFADKNLEECLNVLLTQPPEPLPPVNAYNDANYTDPDVPFGKTWVYAWFGDPDGPQDSLRVAGLKGWWAGLMLQQDRSLTEKMTLFWSNHLAAQMFLMKDARLDYGYVAMLRAYSLGNFKKLVHEITTNPGMLEYLNGNVNIAGAPNENYARELQELFTVGKGPNSHYTEDDVKEAARVLTGWKTEDRAGGVFSLFDASAHDTGDKKFSTFYNNTVIRGKKGQAGKTETDELIDMIFRQRETAKYVCRNIYRWFVYYEIDNTIETNIIEPLADEFVKNNFEIKPVLRTLLASEHFYDVVNIGCQIKNPIDLLIGTCRQFGLNTYPNDLSKQYKQWLQLTYYMKLMGMDPGDPPNVAGFPPTYQSPAFNEIWINATTLTIRNSTTDGLLSERGLMYQDILIQLDILAFTSQLRQAENINSLIRESLKLLCPMPLAKAEVSYLKNILLSGQTSDRYWTDAWEAHLANPADEMSTSVVLSRLRAYYTYLLQRAEYQLC